MAVNGDSGAQTGGGREERPAAAREYLSGREIDVLRLMAAGLTNRQVATVLHMSRHTVAHHLGQMLRRTGARSRGELIARAYAGEIFVIGIWPPSPTGNNRMRFVSGQPHEPVPAGERRPSGPERARQAS